MRLVYQIPLFILFSSIFNVNESTNLLKNNQKHKGRLKYEILNRLTKTKEHLIQLQSLNVSTDFGHIPIYDICTAFLKEFGHNSADFIKCSVEKARPFRFCESCVREYKRAMTTFEDILQDDEKWSGCRNVLLKADRIQVLDQVYNNIRNVWDQAYCNGCFKTGSISEDINGTVKFQYSKISNTFNVIFKNMTKCIKMHSNVSLDKELLMDDIHNISTVSACDACSDLYDDMNREFKDAMKTSQKEVCMDLVDMMNYTRIAWGVKLNCTKSYKTNAGVITITALVAIGTISFYVVVGVKGIRVQKKLMIQKRMSVRSDAASYGATTELHQDGLDDGNGLERQALCS
ncbi:osteopetrosis-associated transmembrane protein 1-like [Mytilus galloprovincialis]|uniref:osteopetrosis-associated transmembrane protein 1-like n=1 Tax=Mytilus galloprovincialis TaxID=29158 RepID=UPI003F7C68DF